MTLLWVCKNIFQLNPWKPFRDVFHRQCFKPQISNLVEDLNPSAFFWTVAHGI